MNGRRSTKPLFELSPEHFGDIAFVPFQFALSRKSGASTEVEAQIAAPLELDLAPTWHGFAFFRRSEPPAGPRMDFHAPVVMNDAVM